MSDETFFDGMPTKPGYYRACVYVTAAKTRGCHQVVAVTDRPVLQDGHPVALERVILQVGNAEPVPPDMVAWWGREVELR